MEQLVGIVNYLAAEPPNVWTVEWSSLIWSSGDLVTELVSVSLGDKGSSNLEAFLERRKRES